MIYSLHALIANAAAHCTVLSCYLLHLIIILEVLLVKIALARPARTEFCPTLTRFLGVSAQNLL